MVIFLSLEVEGSKGSVYIEYNVQFPDFCGVIKGLLRMRLEKKIKCGLKGIDRLFELLFVSRNVLYLKRLLPLSLRLVKAYIFDGFIN